jgi:hypothetical protein
MREGYKNYTKPSSRRRRESKRRSACLPLDLAYLANALEARWTLRRLGFLALDDLILNDLMPLGGARVCLYSLGVQREPLD